MLQNKWIMLIIIVAVIVGLLIVTQAHFGLSVGMAGKTFQIGVQ